ncbi:rRNA biogenesis protein rrp5 [Cytobacillus sp. NCCP-133]|uniref:rRNA biogenesis protein rrp5 n=1 Tax=Cytobacillus sp. NCCP-133 TaxID=766848 RepID=UPI0022325DA7|nr:rRNA biogenesis protein rrp5 [Cytobacillus sp. NCCP-133]GLB61768.1 hypothetical protein NCCP133_38970 [Cytobacillus sp. NCCP-133]
MSKTKLMLDIVNDLRNVAGSIETLALSFGSQTEIAATIEKKQPNKEKEPAKPPKAKLPVFEDVRAKLAALAQDGKQVQVKELITGFGAKKLSDIPAEKYPELLDKADKL